MSIGRILLLLAVITCGGVFSFRLNAATTNAPKAKRDGPALSIARLFRGPVQTEEQLIADLGSSKASTVIDALEKLQDHYEASTNVHSAIKKLLSDQRPVVRRRAARTLGACKAAVDDSDVSSICHLFEAEDVDEILDGLKSLRTLAAPQATTRILPLLQHRHIAVLREACRTLGEIGTYEAIPVVQALTSHREEDVREDAARALVRLKVRAAATPSLSPERGAKSSIGTGFVVATGGYILTCEHVVSGAKTVKIRDTLGRYHLATAVASDAANDLCLLNAPSFTNSPIPAVEVNSVVVGQTVYCLGYPLEGGEAKNLTPVVGNGVVASLRGLEGDSRHLQVTVAMNPGNSGGPVFDESGRWIGVAAHKLADIYSLRKSGQLPQGFNFAVKGSLALTLFDTVPGTRLSTSAKGERIPLEELVKRLSESVVCVIAN